MRFHLIMVSILPLWLLACAQVPPEAIELSATVGRDLAIVHESHRQLATILFNRMKDDVNRFVDDVYAPHQIQFVMNGEIAVASDPDPDVRNTSTVAILNAGLASDASEESRLAAAEATQMLLQLIREDVEEMRHDLLAPLIRQEEEVLSSIDRAYHQLHYANSIVTGHLASIAKVHDAQAELLDAIGVERDLRKTVGEGLVGVSYRIARMVREAEAADDKLETAEEKARALKSEIESLFKHLKPPGVEGD